MPHPLLRNDEYRDERVLEDAIITAYALRFDGYAYQEETGFDGVYDRDGRKLSRNFFDHGTLPDNHLERLAFFFKMQRFLCKWGGEMLPQQGGYWRLYRTLFLDLADADIPPRFRLEDRYAKWEEDFMPHHDASVALVRRIHETTAYAEDPPPEDDGPSHLPAP
ncbi:MAG: hypothetical protein ACOC1G_08545 [Phycisphaeraceae bacterium]